MSTSTNLLSCLMPLHRVDDFVEPAIESVLFDLPKNSELLVVLNGSDLTLFSSLVSKFQSEKRVRFLESKAGIVPALNKGLATSNATYIARMDSDDLVVPGRFKAQISHLERHPEVAVVGTQVDVIDHLERKVGRVYLPNSPGAKLFEQLDYPLVHPASMFRRADAITIGAYSDEYPGIEDFEFWSRMRQLGEVNNLSTLGLKYRVHHNQVSNFQQTQAEVSKLFIALSIKATELEVQKFFMSERKWWLEVIQFLEAKCKMTRQQAALLSYLLAKNLKGQSLIEKVLIAAKIIEINIRAKSGFYLILEVLRYLPPRVCFS